MARATRAGCRAGRANVAFIDSVAAKDAITRGSSVRLASLDVAGDAWAADTAVSARSWYERVPSAANPADGPSRCVLRLGLSQAARLVAPVVPAKWALDGGGRRPW